VKRDSRGRLLPGSVINPLGKQAGTRDKAKVIRAAFFETFNRIGGIDELVRWVNENKINKKEFYKMMLSLLPKEMDVKGEINRPYTVMPMIMKDEKPLEINVGD